MLSGLVRGLNNKRIQRRLLGERHLTLDKAVDLSTSLEAAEKEVETLAKTYQETLEPAVNFLSKEEKQVTPIEVTCFCCGKPNHKVTVCKYKNLTCNTCGKRGHLAVVCKSSRRVKDMEKLGAKRIIKKSVDKQNFIEDNNAESFNNLFHISSDGEKPITMQLLVEGKRTDFEIDSGSPISAVSEGYVRKRK